MNGGPVRQTMIRLSLSTRLILSVVLIQAIMLFVLIWNSVRLINSSHAQLLERSTREESSLLANSVAPGLAANDRALLLDSLALLKDEHDLVYAAVLDRNDKLMAAIGEVPSERHIDQTYDDALSDGVFDIQREIDLFGQPLGTLLAGYSISEVQAFTKQTRLQSTTIAGVGLVLSIIATIGLGLLLTRHLRSLEQGAKALIEQLFNTFDFAVDQGGLFILSNNHFS